MKDAFSTKETNFERIQNLHLSYAALQSLDKFRRNVM